VRAAIELADADGLAAVSMARVAQKLGFTTMSLYRHVSGKDELLTLMLDAVLVLDEHAPAGGWRARLERWAWDVLAIVRRHPWWLKIPISPPPATPNSIAVTERGFAALADTRLDEGEKAAIILLVNGFVLWQGRLETELAPGTGRPADDPLAAYVAVMAGHVTADRFPALRAAVDAGIFFDTEDTRDADFAFGLGLLLDGVERPMEQRAEGG
jgi:AcrR family transcriptional regulator